MKKPKPQNHTTLYLQDEHLARIRMQAIEIAARLPEQQLSTHGMSGGYYNYPGTPGKSAAKVVQDAATIFGFVTAKPDYLRDSGMHNIKGNT